MHNPSNINNQPKTYTKIYKGACLCGAVTYEAVNVSDIWYCHCVQCQKLTGLYISAAGALREDIKITGELRWTPISEKSSSGHCPSCGCYMFWSRNGWDHMSLLTGCMEDTEGLEAKGHIYVGQKASHVTINDGLPQYDEYPPEGTR